MRIALNLRDRAIINALPYPFEGNKKMDILDIGCGTGRLVYHLNRLGFTVTGLDHEYYESWSDTFACDSNWIIEDLYKYLDYEVNRYDVVICSEVLEHLKDWKDVLGKLLVRTKRRLVITVPYKHSFDDSRPAPVGHCNYFDHDENTRMNPTYIGQFEHYAKPYSTQISCIATKPEDEGKQASYLIVIDKEQHYASPRIHM